MPSSKAAKHDRNASALPEFNNPPVVEVAVSVQFTPLEGLDMTRLTLLWNEFKERYPTIEFHPPLARLHEGLQTNAPFQLVVDVSRTPHQRLWFVTEHRTALIQIQHDRVAMNWRKLDTDEPYPHYHELGERLRAELEIVDKFLCTNGIGSIDPDYVELTYVNHIAMHDDGGMPGNLGDVLTVWQNVLFPDERVTFEAKYRIPAEQQDTSTGHLEVTAEPRIARPGTPVTVLQLVVRHSLGKGAGLDTCLSVLNRAHEQLVDAFVKLTTPAMHTIWGRVS